MTELMESHRTGWIADDSTFGARLALVRQRMGWGNLKEAADACGIAVETWRRWERDNVIPRDVVERAWQIAERTGCDYLWLLHGPKLRERTKPLAPRVLKKAGETSMSYATAENGRRRAATQATPTTTPGHAAPPTRATRPHPATTPAPPAAPSRPAPAGPGERRTGRVRRPAA